MTESLAFDRLESYRRELTRYCYRMLASPHDAEDAVQDTLMRAWRGLYRFDEGLGGVRPWLYRIATNVCLDMLKGRQRRALPVELGPPGDGGSAMGDARPEATWVRPIPDALLADDDADPAAVAIGHETVRLAFIAALQHLAPRQRAVLILRDVLSWHAREVARLLDASEDAVNGALKRARATLASAHPSAGPPPTTPAHPGVDRALLDRYVDAFERYDVDALVALLREDAIIAMPPFELWLRGRADIRMFLAAMRDEGGHDRVLPIHANDCPAVAVYRPSSAGVPEPYAIMVLEIADGAIAAIYAFLDTSLFSAFGLPADRLPADGLPAGDQFPPPTRL